MRKVKLGGVPSNGGIIEVGVCGSGRKEGSKKDSWVEVWREEWRDGPNKKS